MKKLLFTILFLSSFLLIHHASATTYYIDFFNGRDANAGTATTTAWQTLNKFMANARSAGDIAYVKRGVSTSTALASATVTSAGNLNNPIIISADYDNLFNNFGTSTETYTLAFGSSTMTVDSGSNNDIVVGSWIYVVGDQTDSYNNPTIYGKDYSYEVSGVSSTSISFFLPYRGNNAGSSKTLRIMPYAPIWGTTALTVQLIWTTKPYWIVQGLEIDSNNASYGNIRNQTTKDFIGKDLILKNGGAGGGVITENTPGCYFKKIRVLGAKYVFVSNTQGNFVEDSLFDCNNVATSYFMYGPGAYGEITNIKDTEVKNCTYFQAGPTTSGYGGIFRTFTNVKMNDSLTGMTGAGFSQFYYEDKYGVVGLNSQTSDNISADTIATTTKSDTSTVRSGGGAVSEEIMTPAGAANTGLSTNYFPYSYLKLFEYPIYANTSSKTYSMYFEATTTTVFTANPTASQFWIECSYYGASSGADRKLTKSVGTIDFVGTSGWQALSVTCTPTQSGILYLRGWYGKPQESGKSNYFFMDTTPVIQ